MKVIIIINIMVNEIMFYDVILKSDANYSEPYLAVLLPELYWESLGAPFAGSMVHLGPYV